MLATLHSFIDAEKNQRPPFGGLSDFRTNLFKSMVCHRDFSAGKFRNGDLRSGRELFFAGSAGSQAWFIRVSLRRAGMKEIVLVPQRLRAVGPVLTGKIAPIDAISAEYRAFPLSRIGHPE